MGKDFDPAGETPTSPLPAPESVPPAVARLRVDARRERTLAAARGPSLRDRLQALEEQARRSSHRAGWIVAGLFLLAGLAGYAVFFGGRPASGAWEYRVESFRDFEWGTASGDPNRLGGEGWEIISARRAEGSSGFGYECILRRRK